MVVGTQWSDGPQPEPEPEPEPEPDPVKYQHEIDVDRLMTAAGFIPALGVQVRPEGVILGILDRLRRLERLFEFHGVDLSKYEDSPDCPFVPVSSPDHSEPS